MLACCLADLCADNVEPIADSGIDLGWRVVTNTITIQAAGDMLDLLEKVEQVLMETEQ